LLPPVLPRVPHRFTGIVALLAGLGALLAAGHIPALLTLRPTFFARLLADLAHLVCQRRVVLHEGNAAAACLDAGQAVLLAGWTVSADKALSAGTHALVAGLYAVLLRDGVKLCLGCDGRRVGEDDRGRDGQKSEESVHDVYLHYAVVMEPNLPDLNT